MEKIISEGIGFIAVSLSIFIFVGSKRESILKLKFLSDTLWMINYSLIGAYTGALLNIIGMARESIFYLRGKKSFASHFYWLPVFALLSLISPLLECIQAGRFVPITLLPAIGSILGVFALYQDRPSATRYLIIVAQVFWIIYSIFCNNISATVASVLSLVSAVIGILIEINSKKSAGNNKKGA